MVLGVLLGGVILLANWLPAEPVSVAIRVPVEQVGYVTHEMHLDAHLGDACPFGLEHVVIVASAPQNEPITASDHPINVPSHYVQIVGVEWELRGHSGHAGGSLVWEEFWDFHLQANDLGGNLDNAILCCGRSSVEPSDADEKGFCRITGLRNLGYLVFDGGHLRTHGGHLNPGHQLSGFGAVLGCLDGAGRFIGEPFLKLMLLEGDKRQGERKQHHQEVGKIVRVEYPSPKPSNRVADEARLIAAIFGGLGVAFTGGGYYGLLRSWDGRWQRRLGRFFGVCGLILGALFISSAGHAFQCVLGYGCPG